MTSMLTILRWCPLGIFLTLVSVQNLLAQGDNEIGDNRVQETQLHYLDQTYLFECEARVEEVNPQEDPGSVVLNQTVFYPQGGGQPADQGILRFNSDSIHVKNVKFKNGKVYHSLNFDGVSLKVGDLVQCRIDPDWRVQNAACHTGGHLIASMVEAHFPQLKAIKSFHFPQGPYIEFIGHHLERERQEWLSYLNRLLAQEVKRGGDIQVSYSVQTQSDQETKFQPRQITIDSFAPIFCGGTHLSSLSHLSQVNITKLKFTKNGLKLKYNTKVNFSGFSPSVLQWLRKL